MKKQIEIYGGEHNIITPIVVNLPSYYDTSNIDLSFLIFDEFSPVSKTSKDKVKKHMCNKKECMCHPSNWSYKIV